MSTKQKTDLSLQMIAHRLEQLQAFQCTQAISLKDLAKELGTKVTELMDVMDRHPKHFVKIEAEKGKSKVLCLTKCYLDIADNPANPEYITKRREENAKTIELSYYDNYGHISGYYIQPSRDTLKAQYLNSKEKVEQLKNRFALKPASYVLGGQGDVSVIKPENGWQIKVDQLDQLVSEGWTIIGEYFAELSPYGTKHDKDKKIRLSE